MNGHKTNRDTPVVEMAPTSSSQSRNPAGGFAIHARANAAPTIANATVSAPTGIHATRRACALADANLARESDIPVKYTFVIAITSHMPSATCTRRTPPSGETAATMSDPNNIPSCERSIRWTSRWRRATGAGKRN